MWFVRLEGIIIYLILFTLYFKNAFKKCFVPNKEVTYRLKSRTSLHVFNNNEGIFSGNYIISIKSSPFVFLWLWKKEVLKNKSSILFISSGEYIFQVLVYSMALQKVVIYFKWNLNSEILNLSPVPPQAANPGCALDDFVRWYSPRDYVEEEVEDEKGNMVLKGMMSSRMMIPGNMWVEAWESARVTPARRQRRLFDDTKEAEKVIYTIQLT